MQRVTLIDDPLDPASWERLEVEDARAVICERYPAWPSNGRIFEGTVALDREVTPRTKAEVDRLPEYPDLFVVVFPEHIALALIIVIVVTVILTAALMFLLPSIPNTNQQATSANNSLSERTNKPRVGGRIGDIFGEVRSIPDLLAVPYRVYENHHEVEISFMCIGRGSYDVSDVRDGDTLISEIAGSSAAVYPPGTSPNNGMTPQLQIGAAISDPLFNVARLNEVNGQILKAPNDNAVRASTEIAFADGGVIQAAAGSVDFTQYFHAGDTLAIGGATDTGIVSNQAAVFVAATGVAPNKFTFASFDPTTKFAVGQTISVTGAVYTTATAPAGGDISGSETNPDYPYDPYGNNQRLEVLP